jgi:hypothetical protein
MLVNLPEHESSEYLNLYRCPLSLVIIRHRTNTAGGVLFVELLKLEDRDFVTPTPPAFVQIKGHEIQRSNKDALS